MGQASHPGMSDTVTLVVTKLPLSFTVLYPSDLHCKVVLWFLSDHSDCISSGMCIIDPVEIWCWFSLSSKMFLLLFLLFSLIHSLACLFIRWFLTVCEYCYKELRISHEKQLYRVCLSASSHPLYEMLLVKGQLIHKCHTEQSPSSVAVKSYSSLNKLISMLNILKTIWNSIAVHLLMLIFLLYWWECRTVVKDEQVGCQYHTNTILLRFALEASEFPL